MDDNRLSARFTKGLSFYASTPSFFCISGPTRLSLQSGLRIRLRIPPSSRESHPQGSTIETLIGNFRTSGYRHVFFSSSQLVGEAYDGAKHNSTPYDAFDDFGTDVLSSIFY